jgi:hypothetical protein
MQVSQNDYLIFIIPVINTEFPPDYREYPSGEPSGCIWPPGDRDRAYYSSSRISLININIISFEDTFLHTTGTLQFHDLICHLITLS